MSFNVNKPIRLRRGGKVELIAITPNLVGGRCIIAKHATNDGKWAVNTWYENGHFYPSDRNDPYDLINE